MSLTWRPCFYDRTFDDRAASAKPIGRWSNRIAPSVGRGSGPWPIGELFAIEYDLLLYDVTST
ncbi:MAG: hypothetical protein WD875_10780, partial [Pirellulales bacterium]